MRHLDGVLRVNEVQLLEQGLYGMKSDAASRVDERQGEFDGLAVVNDAVVQDPLENGFGGEWEEGGEEADDGLCLSVLIPPTGEVPGGADFPDVVHGGAVLAVLAQDVQAG